MSTNKSLVLRRIKDTFNSTLNIPNNLRLPGSIMFYINGNEVEMHLNRACVESNMQEDKAAFEGWALVLKRWGKFDRVWLKWDRQHYDASNAPCAHYQRFLFRAYSFSRDFNTWFGIVPECKTYLNALRINDIDVYYLSPPHNNRDNKNLRGKESILEYNFSYGKWSGNLKKITNAFHLDRQFPVGIFNKPVSRKTSILPRGKSAIDIWGLSRNKEVLVFELKAAENDKVGIISELYFYTQVMNRIRSGQFKYEKIGVQDVDMIVESNKIIGYLFAPFLHPLIDSVLIETLNAGTLPGIEFQCLKFNERTGEVEKVF